MKLGPGKCDTECLESWLSWTQSCNRIFEKVFCEVSGHKVDSIFWHKTDDQHVHKSDKISGTVFDKINGRRVDKIS